MPCQHGGVRVQAEVCGLSQQRISFRHKIAAGAQPDPRKEFLGVFIRVLESTVRVSHGIATLKALRNINPTRAGNVHPRVSSNEVQG
jgi:hypothetical protein